MSYSQYRKDTIYVMFEKNKGEKPYYRGIKFYKQDEKGIVFNLLNEGSLLYSNHLKTDTLHSECLNNFSIATAKEINQKIKEFRYKTYGKRPSDKNDKLYQFYNKNDIFITYLIEVISEEKFVVYPVKWRNQDIID